MKSSDMQKPVHRKAHDLPFRWSALPHRFFVLAPMGNITDFSFREIVARYAKPDVLFTEFVNVEALFSKGHDAEMTRLKISSIQHPIIAQLWGNAPENYGKAAQLAEKLGFDGVDINMGCSIRKILARDAGGKLIGQTERCADIIAAVRDGSKRLPVSVKTRLGVDSFSEEWFQFLLSQKIDALTIHGRTVKAGYKGSADWTKIQEIVMMKNSLNPDTRIIGNGDVSTKEQGTMFCLTYGTDGVMIGRAILRNFFLFDSKQQDKYIFNIISDHLDLEIHEKGGKTDGSYMRKYYKMYLRSFDGAAEIRQKLMSAKNLEQAKKIVNSIGKTDIGMKMNYKE